MRLRIVNTTICSTLANHPPPPRITHLFAGRNAKPTRGMKKRFSCSQRRTEPSGPTLGGKTVGTLDPSGATKVLAKSSVRQNPPASTGTPKKSQRRPALTVSRGATFHSSRKYTPPRFARGTASGKPSPVPVDDG